MTNQEAVGILMLSPFYFKMCPADRKILVQEYCENLNKLAMQLNETENSNK